jgi:hypothetical protein
MNRVLFILFALLLIFPDQSPSQTVPQATIRGRVIDDSTGTAVFLANAYVANTVLGSTTDSTGKFEINRVPVGPHTLIVSLVGYRTVLTELDVNESESPIVTVRLKPKQLQAAEVEVTARVPTEWKKNLQTFERWFLGTSENARFCKILNPEILDFTSGGDWIEFEAIPPQQPIKIENRALGYTVYYILTRFRYVQKHLETGGVARFESLVPRDSDEARSWHQNRLRSYFGSLRHFLSSLARRTYNKEGFEILHTTDILGRYREDVNVDEIVHATALPFKKILTFRGYLEVTYAKANAEKSYSIYEWRVGTTLPSGKQPQTSWIFLDAPDVTVDMDGNIDGPFVIQETGYWTFLRIANMLPSDYTPEH